MMPLPKSVERARRVRRFLSSRAEAQGALSSKGLETAYSVEGIDWSCPRHGRPVLRDP